MTKATCHGCGKPIIWGTMVMPDGSKKRIPMDPRPAVYSVIENGPPLLIRRDMNAYVTHFATCPKASDF